MSVLVHDPDVWRGGRRLRVISRTDGKAAVLDMAQPMARQTVAVLAGVGEATAVAEAVAELLKLPVTTEEERARRAGRKAGIAGGSADAVVVARTMDVVEGRRELTWEELALPDPREGRRA